MMIDKWIIDFLRSLELDDVLVPYLFLLLVDCQNLIMKI